MSRQASPTIIGAFVLGALVLVLVGIVVFGSGKFFTDTVKVVMYFEGDLKGLRTGASVDFEGVPLGTVTDVGLFVNINDYSARTPVVVEIQRDRFRLVGGDTLPGKGQALKAMVEQRGLRAQLRSESLVTGQLYIQLAYYPDVPPRQLIVDPLTNLPEIPTIPTTLQEAQETVRKALVKISELPLEEIVTSLNGTLQGIERLVNAPEVIESIRNLNTALRDVQQLVRNVDKQVTPLTTSATETLASVTGAAGDIGKLARNTDGAVAALASSLQQTVGTARNTLETTQEALKNINNLMEPHSPVGYELVNTLRQLSEAARALRVLADYLERHPNAVLFGKNEGKAQ